MDIIFHENMGGLFSVFNKLMTFLYYNETPISSIRWQVNGRHMMTYHVDELFSHLFKQYNNPQYPRPSCTVHIGHYTSATFTGVDIHHMYKRTDNEWKTKMHDLFKKHVVYTEQFDNMLAAENACLQNYISSLGFSPTHIVSILFRNHKLFVEQPMKRMPNYEEYMAEISKFDLDKTVFIISADNEADLAWCKSQVKYSFNQANIRRSKTAHDEEIHTHSGTVHDAYMSYADVYLLSKGTDFIHPISNMATAVYFMNPDIQCIYLWRHV